MNYKSALTHPLVKPLLLAFLLLNLAVTEYGGTNAKARGALLRAMSEAHSFKITNYKDWTIDWARTPDGEYYSNKAPGPMLLGFPLYWTIEQISKPFENGWRDDRGRRREPGYIQHTVFMLGLQLLPYALICALLVGLLRSVGASPNAQIFALLAALFGNSAVVFMNSNFGHGFAAVLVSAVGYALWQRHYLLLGLLTGFAVLSDYGMIMQLPALGLAMLFLLQREEARLKKIALFFMGTIHGAILWCWYHYVAFGGIFSLPSKFQNPDFVGTETPGWNLWGVITLPSPQILYELILGPSRGILVTQPYVLLAPLVMGFIYLWRKSTSFGEAKRFEKLALGIYIWGSLLGLLVMNAGFNGWHGGHSPGPRYISAIFPLMAFWFGLYLDRVPQWLKAAAWAALGAALIFRALAYAHGLLVPPEPMWPYLLKHLTAGSMTPALRVAIFAVVVGCGVFFAKRGMARLPQSS